MKLFSILLALLFAIGISGCNTISGAGQDVQAAGEKVEEVAEDTKEKMKDDD